MTTPILLDCDPGHDDAIAILLAVASPEVELRAVTTVAGNQTLEKTTRNAIRVLDLVGRSDVPLARGADRPLVRPLRTAPHVHGESGLDGPALPEASREPDARHAVQLLADELLAAPEPVTLVATGPLTNVGLLLARHPDAAARIARLVVMGGAIAEGNITPAAEFNVWVDPEAARRVFEGGLDVTLVTIDVTHRALLRADRSRRLRAGGPVARFVADLVEFFDRFHARQYGFDGSPIHDALALATVIRPDLVETLRTHVAIDCESPLCAGRTVVDRWRVTGEEPNAAVSLDVDADAFLDLLVERVESLDG